MRASSQDRRSSVTSPQAPTRLCTSLALHRIAAAAARPCCSRQRDPRAVCNAKLTLGAARHGMSGNARTARRALVIIGRRMRPARVACPFSCKDRRHEQFNDLPLSSSARLRQPQRVLLRLRSAHRALAPAQPPRQGGGGRACRRTGEDQTPGHQILETMRPIEEFNAYPGAGLMARVDERLGGADWTGLARLVQHISAALMSNGYREEESAWAPTTKARTDRRLPAPVGGSRTEPPAVLRSPDRRRGRTLDLASTEGNIPPAAPRRGQFVYEAVVVGSFEDAVLAGCSIQPAVGRDHRRLRLQVAARAAGAARIARAAPARRQVGGQFRHERRLARMLR